MKDLNFYQAQYDSGKSLDTICRDNPEAKRFFLQKNLKFRSRSQAAQGPRKPLSDAHKKKLSEKQTKFLMENPDQVPYRKYHHSKFKSFPEKVFQDELVRQGIVGWVPEFRHSIYSYDIAFVEEKIDVEIDGATHSSPKVIEIDRKRDAWSESMGWRVIRFSAQEVKIDPAWCVEQLKHLLETRGDVV